MLLAPSHELDILYGRTLAGPVASLAITAPRAGCGTTTVALALARRAAAGGRRVLLVELDLQRPSLSATLEIGSPDWSLDEPGAPGSQAVVRVEGMDVLTVNPSISRNPRSREPKAMESAVRAWETAYDCVLLDCPPLGGGAGGLAATAIGAAANGTVLVLLSGYSTSTEAERAARQLTDAGCRLLGTILNDRDNPTLAQELSRQLARFERLAPGLIGRARRWLERSETLNLRS